MLTKKLNSELTRLQNSLAILNSHRKFTYKVLSVKPNDKLSKNSLAENDYLSKLAAKYPDSQKSNKQKLHAVGLTTDEKLAHHARTWNLKELTESHEKSLGLVSDPFHLIYQDEVDWVPQVEIIRTDVNVNDLDNFLSKEEERLKNEEIQGKRNAGKRDDYADEHRIKHRNEVDSSSGFFGTAFQQVTKTKQTEATHKADTLRKKIDLSNTQEYIFVPDKVQKIQAEHLADLTNMDTISMASYIMRIMKNRRGLKNTQSVIQDYFNNNVLRKHSMLSFEQFQAMAKCYSIEVERESSRENVVSTRMDRAEEHSNQVLGLRRKHARRYEGFACVENIAVIGRNTVKINHNFLIRNMRIGHEQLGYSEENDEVNNYDLLIFDKNINVDVFGQNKFFDKSVSLHNFVRKTVVDKKVVLTVDSEIPNFMQIMNLERPRTEKYSIQSVLRDGCKIFHKIKKSKKFVRKLEKSDQFFDHHMVFADISGIDTNDVGKVLVGIEHTESKISGKTKLMHMNLIKIGKTVDNFGFLQISVPKGLKFESLIGFNFYVLEIPFSADIRNYIRKSNNDLRNLNETITEYINPSTKLKMFINFKNVILQGTQDLPNQHIEKGQYLRGAKVMTKDILSEIDRKEIVKPFRKMTATYKNMVDHERFLDEIPKLKMQKKVENTNFDEELAYVRNMEIVEPKVCVSGDYILLNSLVTERNVGSTLGFSPPVKPTHTRKLNIFENLIEDHETIEKFDGTDNIADAERTNQNFSNASVKVIHWTENLETGSNPVCQINKILLIRVENSENSIQLHAGNGLLEFVSMIHEFQSKNSILDTKTTQNCINFRGMMLSPEIITEIQVQIIRNQLLLLLTTDFNFQLSKFTSNHHTDMLKKITGKSNSIERFSGAISGPGIHPGINFAIHDYVNKDEQFRDCSLVVDTNEHTEFLAPSLSMNWPKTWKIETQYRYFSNDIIRFNVWSLAELKELEASLHEFTVRELEETNYGTNEAGSIRKSSYQENINTFEKNRLFSCDNVPSELQGIFTVLISGISDNRHKTRKNEIKPGQISSLICDDSFLMLYFKTPENISETSGKNYKTSSVQRLLSSLAYLNTTALVFDQVRDRYDESVKELDGEFTQFGKHKQRVMNNSWTVGDGVARQLKKVYEKVADFEIGFENGFENNFENLKNRRFSSKSRENRVKVKKLAEFSEFHVERKRNYESRKAEINDRKDVLNIFDCDA